MKKLRVSFLAVFLLLLLSVPASNSLALGQKKITIMVYLCGSNLESLSGSASLDIQEMTEAGINSDEVQLLVLTGGSSSWAGGYDPEETNIVEVSSRGRRFVSRSEKKNMGDPETVTGFIDYAVTNYPAEDYALIFWDHGAGPLEGVCWDELFSLDHLTLNELVSGIKNSSLPKKLRWIGFDACYMGSVEVANALYPYAEYMIASQESEPASGWNYSFLKGIEEDPSGFVTGQRIVDAFFSDPDDLKHADMTLSCLDLNAVGDLVALLSSTFTSVLPQMEENTFPEFSKLRNSTVSFGTVRKGFVDDNGYDLVDLGSLLNNIQRLYPQLETKIPDFESFCYSRSSIPGATGLSIYHPYSNKEKFYDEWYENYLNLPFSRAYISYITKFSTLLFSDTHVDWSSIKIQELKEPHNGQAGFFCQLTDEQAENIVSAELLILDRPNGRSFRLLSASKASLMKNTIEAVYDNKLLYVQKKDGELVGPVDFSLSMDQTKYTIPLCYTVEGMEERTFASAALRSDQRTEAPEFMEIKPFDTALGTYTNRMTINEELYEWLLFWGTERLLPEAESGSLLPEYSIWDTDTHVFARGIPLPDDWHFSFRENMDASKQLYAMFQIRDVHQNLFCTMPVPVTNSNFEYFQVSAPGIGNEDVKIDIIDGYVDIANEAVVLEFFISSGGSEALRTQFGDLLVNGERIITEQTRREYNYPFIGLGTTTADYDAGDDGKHGCFQQCVIPASELFGISQMREISLSLDIQDTEGLNIGKFPVSISMDSVDISGLNKNVEVLAQSEKNGLLWQLIDCRREFDDRIALGFVVTNQSSKTISSSLMCAVNNIQTEEYQPHLELPPQRSRRIVLRADSPVTIHKAYLALPSVPSDILSYDSVFDQHEFEQHKVTGLSEILVFIEDGSIFQVFQEAAYLTLNPPVPIPPKNEKEYFNYAAMAEYVWPESDQITEEQTRTIFEGRSMKMLLKKTLVGENGLALCLEIQNFSDQLQRMKIDHVRVNDFGIKAEQIYVKGPSRIHIDMLPKASYIHSFTIEKLDALLNGDAIRNITFDLLSEDCKVISTITITMPEGTTLSTEEAVMITGDKVSSSHTPEEVPAEPEPDEPFPVISKQLLIPESIKDYLHWYAAPVQDAEASLVTALIAKKTDDGFWQLLNIQNATRNEAGELGVRVPHLILSTTNSPDTSLMMATTRCDDSALEGEIRTRLMFYSRQNEFFSASGLSFSVRVAENEGTVIIGNETIPNEEDGGYYLTVQIPPYEYYYQTPAPPHLSEWIFNDDFMKILNAPEIPLEKKSLELELRPIQPEDGIYLFFSIEDTNGKKYGMGPLSLSEE